MRRVAVIGSGIAGLASAWELSRLGGAEACRVTLFEADERAGGHAHTVDVTLPGADGRPVTHGVDTGFLVFNQRTYPRLIQLFQTLGVETAESDMSFSVQSGALEWSGSSLATVFAQRRNLANPRFLGMLLELLRFNRITTQMALTGDADALQQGIGEFLDEHRFSQAFREWYFLPMIACIWSCPAEQMLAFPVATMIRFCHNHGLLQVADRPQWMTVRGGSREYVRRMVAGICSTGELRLSTPVTAVRRFAHGLQVHTANGPERFDDVVLACHTDQALRLLGTDATLQERHVLGAIRYRPNTAVLHTDTALLPRRRQAWAAWNHEHAVAGTGGPDAGVCLHYLINRLQPLPFAQPVLVSLNPMRAPRADQVIARFQYDHPVFDSAAIRAQAELPALQGHQHTWFCGAWAGCGFHEDGLKSAQDLLLAMRLRYPVAQAA